MNWIKCLQKNLLLFKKFVQILFPENKPSFDLNVF